MNLQEPDNFPKKSIRTSRRALVWTIAIGIMVAILLYLIGALTPL